MSSFLFPVREARLRRERDWKMQAATPNRMRITHLATPPRSSSPARSSGRASPQRPERDGRAENSAQPAGQGTPSTPTPTTSSCGLRSYPTPERTATPVNQMMATLREKFAFKSKLIPETKDAVMPEGLELQHAQSVATEAALPFGSGPDDLLDPAVLEEVALDDEQDWNQRLGRIASEQAGPDVHRRQTRTPSPIPDLSASRGSTVLSRLKIYLKRNYKGAYSAAVRDSELQRTLTGASINRFCIILPLDVAHLWEYDNEIGQLLLDGEQSGLEDSVLHDGFLSASRAILEEQLPSGYILLPEQIRLFIRLESVPPFPEYCLNSIADALPNTRGPAGIRGGRMQSITGIVAWLSEPNSVLHSRTYRCLQPRCIDPSYLHYELFAAPSRRVLRRQAEGGKYLPATTSTYLHDVDLLCSCCGERMKELVVDRQYIRRQWGRLDCPAKLLGVVPASCMMNSVPFMLSYDLVSQTIPGDFVELIGTLEPYNPSSNLKGLIDHGDLSFTRGCFVQVNNLHRIDPTEHIIRNLKLSTPARLCDDYERNKVTDIPEQIRTLQAARLHPWSFSQRIVDMFGAHLVRGDSFRRVRLAYLLSLVSTPTIAPLHSQRDNKLPRRALHICVVSSSRCPSLASLTAYAAGMKAGAKWERLIEGDLPPLLGGGERERLEPARQRNNKTCKHPGRTHVTAAPWNMSRGGVLLLESDSVDPGAASQKAAAKEIAMALQASNGECANPPCIWMLSVADKSCVGNKRPKSSIFPAFCSMTVHRASATTLSKTNLPLAHLSAKDVTDAESHSTFDLYLSVRLSVNHTCLDMAESVINDAIGINEASDGPSKTGTPMSQVDFAQYIFAASNLTIRLSPACKKLLKCYWQARRRLLGIVVPGVSHLESLATLLRLTAAHAKLCLCAVAGIDDALVSILLYEEHTADRFSVSLLGFTSLPDDGENVRKLYAPSVPMRAPRRWLGPDYDSPEVGGRSGSGGENRIGEGEEGIMARLYAHIRRICQTAGVASLP